METTGVAPSPPVPPVTIAVHFIGFVRAGLYLRGAMQVREFIDGADVAQALLVRDVEDPRPSRTAAWSTCKLTCLAIEPAACPLSSGDGVAQARTVCALGEVVYIARPAIRCTPGSGPELQIHSGLARRVRASTAVTSCSTVRRGRHRADGDRPA